MEEIAKEKVVHRGMKDKMEEIAKEKVVHWSCEGQNGEIQLGKSPSLEV